MPVTLDQIVAATRLRVAETKAKTPACDLEQQAGTHVSRGFRLSLTAVAAERTAVITELKKASPSRGVIRGTMHVASIASEYAAAGAAALSVLTEEEFFQGSLANLREASAATELPCLRKDFIVDEFQLLEAKANHADAVLLIVAALSQPELLSLSRRSRELGMDVLCEVHDETELERALDAGFDIIGVNSRDLRTFTVDLHTALRLGPLIPRNVLGVAESGIHSGHDVARLRAAGYQAFLIGELLMKADHPGQALKALLAETTQAVRSL